MSNIHYVHISQSERLLIYVIYYCKTARLYRDFPSCILHTSNAEAATTGITSFVQHDILPSRLPAKGSPRSFTSTKRTSYYCYANSTGEPIPCTVVYIVNGVKEPDFSGGNNGGTVMALILAR